MFGSVAIYSSFDPIGAAQGDLSRLLSLPLIEGDWWIWIAPKYESIRSELGRSLGIQLRKMSTIVDPVLGAIPSPEILIQYRHVGRGYWPMRYWGWVGFPAVQTEIGLSPVNNGYYRNSTGAPAIYASPFVEPQPVSPGPVAHTESSPKIKIAPNTFFAYESNPQPISIYTSIKSGQSIEIRIREFKVDPAKSTPASITDTIPTNGNAQSDEDIVTLESYSFTAWALKIG
jgi:hypothetical protein